MSLRVLQIHNSQPSPGGIAVVIANERGLLESAGCKVEQYLIESSQIFEISRPRAAVKTFWNFEALREIDSLIAQFNPDVVHVYTPFPLLSPAVFRLTAKRSLPTVATVQSFRFSCIKGVLYRDGQVCELCLGRKFKFPGIRHRCYHSSVLASSTMAASLALHRAAGTFHEAVDFYIAASHFVRRKLIEEGFPPQKIVVKSNSVPDPGMGNGRADHAVYAGRLKMGKGIETLLHAWALLEAPPQLVILGDGPLRPIVEQAAAGSPSIRCLGWVDQPAVLREVAAARFLILPSEWYEGHPVVAVEAFAAGTPIIASDVGNFSDMIDPGVNGYHFKSGDAQSLAATVDLAWQQPDIDKMVRAARRSYEDAYTQERDQQTLLSIYERAIRLRKPAVASGGSH
jgi:glycosyltransferase involved in cell wall biosynthesis